MKIRTSLARLLALSLCCSTVLQGMTVAAADGADDPASVNIGQSAISIGNSKISREFTIADGKVYTNAVRNKRINRNLNPAAGSEDFVISAKYQGNTSGSGSSAVGNEQRFGFDAATPLDRSGWSASITTTPSEGETYSVAAADAAKVLDGDLSTHPDDYRHAGNPTEVVIDMKGEKTVSAFSVNKRPGYTDQAYGINGTMGAFEVYASNDGETWTKVMSDAFSEAEYNLHQEGTLYNVGDTVGRNFPSAVSARYIKIRQTSNALGVEGEFTTSEIKFYENKVEQTTVLPTRALDRSSWTGTITPANNGKLSDGAFASLIDGDLTTHPDEGGNGQGNHNGFPINVDINLGEAKTISSFAVDKRPGYTTQTDGVNGTMGDYEIYTSENGTDWTKVSQGSIPASAYNLHQDGNLYNVGDRVFVNLHNAVTTQYFRLSVTSNALGSSNDFTMSELNLYEDGYQGPDYRTNMDVAPSERLIRTSDLTYKDASSIETENGQKLTISYEPIAVGDSNWTVDEVFVLEDGKDYMRSFLEITTDDPKHSVIDYIDTDAFVIPQEDESTVWHHSNSPRNTVGGLKGYEFLLGQPVYVDGMYMGSEFPATDTTVPNNSSTIQIRYYSGKSFERLGLDNQLTTDGKFVSWQNVIGSARGLSTSEVQSDFFEYIKDIATPTVFRKQYNSWYDNMKEISDESIEVSFTQVEENLTANGVDPLDSYVVDDGWISYNSSSAESGNTPNKTGFWEINDKFPDDFFRSSAFASKLQSTFGVWIGPRGGYGSEGNISTIIQNAGTGYKSSAGDICVASRKYIRNFTSLAEMFQQEYGVSYWKWDGFVMNVCSNAEHDHMTGGPHNMYFSTDLWEGWIDLFESVRADMASRGQSLFINATCFVQLSPWLLQWVNTIWLQDSHDTQMTGSGEKHEQKIYYRDNVYYNLLKEYQVQFPTKNLYNHEPIYGVSDLGGASNCTDGTWREYLLANAMRGTRFWELYFSPSIVNPEKYEITADVLEWMETNQDVLGNTKMHGGRPANKDVYGYSAWTKDEGIVSFTNPKDEAATGSLVLDAQAGVVAGMGKKSAIQVEPFVTGILSETYGYGDTLTVELEPHETKIFHFGTSSAGAPALLSAKNSDNETLSIKFDQRVEPVSASINGKSVETTRHDDYRTIDVPYTVNESGNVIVKMTIKDAFGSETSVDVNVPVYRHNMIVDTKTAGVLGEDADAIYDVTLGDYLLDLDKKAVTLNTKNRLEGSSDFTIHTSVKTTSKDADLFRSNNDVSLRINSEGFVEFTVAGRTVSSKEQLIHVSEKAHGTFGTEEYVPHVLDRSDIQGNVADDKIHTIDASRTPNGMLKIYIDGELRASLHDPELKGLVLSGKEMTLGSDDFSGTIGRLTISNGADFLEDIENKAPTEESASVMYDRSGWTAEACSEASSGSDQGAMAAIDSISGNRWHTNYSGSDHCASQSHWIKVNFNAETPIDTIYYTGRGETINGSIKDYKLEILGKDGEVLLTKEGQMTSSAAEQAVPLDQRVNAYGFKLTQKSSWNGRDFGAANELRASVVPVKMSEDDLVDAKEELLEDIDLSGSYTTESLEAAQAAKDKVERAANATDVSWQLLRNELLAAKAALVDTTALDATLTQADALENNLPNVAEELLDAFRDALASARHAKSSGTAETVAQADSTLKAAIAALNEAPTLDVDKSQLRLVRNKLDGLNKADFKNTDGLDSAIAQADEILASSEDQKQINEKAEELNTILLSLRLKPSATKLGALQ